MSANKIKKLKTNQRIQHTKENLNTKLTNKLQQQSDNGNAKHTTPPSKAGSISTQKRRKRLYLHTEKKKEHRNKEKTIRMTTIMTACIKSQKTEKEYSLTTQKYHQQGPPSRPPPEHPQNKGPTRRNDSISGSTSAYQKNI